MRFPDTFAGWTEQMHSLKSNQHVRNYLKAISPADLVLVRNRKKGVTSKQPAYMCHNNVAKLVDRIGGSAENGWLVAPYMTEDNPYMDGIITSMFHCNWRTPENEIVNVTPFSGEYHIFLADSSRKFDFKTNTGYNSRTIFLDNFNPPFTIPNPTRNVNYYSSGQYWSRDRLFEKFTIFNNVDDAVDKLPAHMKTKNNGIIHISDEGKKWLSMRYSVNEAS